MRLMRFGGLYFDPDKVLYARRFLPEVKGLPPNDEGGVRLGFDQREITVYEVDPGFAELLAWLDRNSETPA